MFCQYCGRTVRDGASFCPNCGKPTELKGAETTPGEAEATPTSVSVASPDISDTADATRAAGPATPTQQTPAPQPPSPQVPVPQTPKKSHAALIAGLAVGAIFVLLALGLALFAIPMLQGAKKGGSSSKTVIELSELEDSAWAGYLSQNVDKNSDGLISKREAELVTSIGNLAEDLTTGNGLCSAGVYDLEGIEYFTNLKVLLVYDNDLIELDLSDNTKLRYLDCSENILAELELPATDSLETVYAYGNLFVSLDVTDCPNLENLYVDSNVVVTGFGGSASGYAYDPDDAYDYDELLDELLDEGEGSEDAQADSAESDLQSA